MNNIEFRSFLNIILIYNEIYITIEYSLNKYEIWIQFYKYDVWVQIGIHIYGVSRLVIFASEI